MTSEYCFSECERILSMINSFRNSFAQMYSDIRQTVVYTRYGIGGDCMHMGFYCPSRIIDIVTGNINRGFMVKELGRRKASFEYGFDIEKRLVSIIGEHSKEIVMYDNAKIMSFCVSDAETYTISECILDTHQRLLSYSVYLSLDSTPRITEFTREIYNYDDDLLTTDWYRFSCYCKERPILQHVKYVFSKDNGDFSSYTMENYCQGKLSPSRWDGHVFKIPNKKKTSLTKPGDDLFSMTNI